MSRDLVQALKFRRVTVFDVANLEAAFERGYLSMSRGDKFTKKKTFAPSSIGGYQGVCPRYWYQAFDGAMFKDRTDAQGFANMANGSAAHKRLEDVLERSGILVEAEREFWIEDPPIHGFIDAIVELDGMTIAGELKTTRDQAFSYRVTTGKPMAQHLYQILIYMKSQSLQFGFLFYENKDDQTFVIVPVEMTPENEAILEEAFEWLRTVRQAWENRTLPKRMSSARNKACKGCPLWDACWNTEGVDEGSIKIAPMEIVTL